MREQNEQATISAFDSSTGREPSPIDSPEVVQSSIESVIDLEQIVITSRHDLLKIAQCYTRNDPDEAEDIVQQATFHAFKHLRKEGYAMIPSQGLHNPPLADRQGRGRRIKNAEGWICTIVRNTACNYYTSKKTQEKAYERAGGLLQEHWGSENPETDFVSGEARREIRTWVDALPKKYRTVIMLQYFENCPLQDIASRLNLPLNTVKSQISRGLSLLREAMTDQREVIDGKIGRRKKQAS